MKAGTIETSPQVYARLAGVCYLLGSSTSVFGQMIIPGRLVVSGDAATTAANILAHESLYRFGAVLMSPIDPSNPMWAILFFQLFKPVNRSIPLLAAFVLLMGCAMWTLSVLFSLAPLFVLDRKSVV